MPLNIQEPAPTSSPRGFALFALGFRPFFLLSGLFAVALMLVWVGVYTGAMVMPPAYGLIGWHAHEMLFGYTMAVVAGFLLTAVRNWSGVDTPTGASLAAIAGIWVAARVLPFVSGLPYWSVALVDLLFLPAIAAGIAVPLIKAGQKRSYVFIVLLGLAAGANLLFHLEAGGVVQQWGTRALYFTVDLVLVVIAIMGGRVIPFFIEKGLPPGGPQPRGWHAVDMLSIGSVAALAVAELLYPQPWLVGAVALAAFTANAVRLVGWHVPGVWRVPLLWVLFLGYAWLVVGLLLKLLAAAGLVTPQLALHAFTTGAIGVLTLGMMARVSLGHTGRMMQAPRFIPSAFFLVNAAAAVRVLAPLLAPALYVSWIAASALLWIIAFGIFTAVYTPILIRPRVDGRPG